MAYEEILTTETGVVGPGSATSGDIAVFDGTTGKLVKDSGFTIATSVPSGAVFTDAKVTNTLNTTTKAYITGTTSSTTNTGTQIFDTGVYLDTTAGKLNAKSVEIGTPNDISGSETTTAKFKTSNGGAIIFGKEGPNNGTMIRLDQDDGTARLRFRASSTAGAMVWEQPEQGAQLYIDLGKDGADKHRIQFPRSAGTLALTGHTHSISNITDLQSTLNTKVPTSRTVNGYSLSDDIELSAYDVGATPDSHMQDMTIHVTTELTSNVNDALSTAHSAESIASSAQNWIGNHDMNSDIHITPDERDMWNSKADAPFKPSGKSYLTFSSPNSFTLKVKNSTKHWDGTLEYLASDKAWTVWNGTTLSSVDNDGEYVLYFRGTGNTVITGIDDFNPNETNHWILTGSDISCIGNIENILDYRTVESGAHPTMATRCYFGMFNGCTALTKAPDLPATTLSDGCYHSMFYGCTALTKAPALPATTLAPTCYYNMFYGCTALIQAPALPATTLAYACYQYMFTGCTSLTKAPALPATTLANYCYQYMFQSCTSLTQAPALPATTLVDGCYSYMFRGCTNLKLSSTPTAEYVVEYCIPSSGMGTTVSSALLDMFTSTGGTFTGTPEINMTYYLSSDNMVVRETEIATLNGYVGSMIGRSNPTITTVTLTAANWDSTAKTQTVTVTGILADETKQLIQVMPAPASTTAVTAAGAYCSAQGANSLTFTCSTVPTENLVFNISFQDANYV